MKVLGLLLLLGLSGCAQQHNPFMGEFGQGSKRPSEETEGAPDYTLACVLANDASKENPSLTLGCYLGDKVAKKKTVEQEQISQKIDWSYQRPEGSSATITVEATPDHPYWHVKYVFQGASDTEVRATALATTILVQFKAAQTGEDKQFKGIVKDIEDVSGENGGLPGGLKEAVKNSTGGGSELPAGG